jgi:hypothetical protein
MLAHVPSDGLQSRAVGPRRATRARRRPPRDPPAPGTAVGPRTRPDPAAPASRSGGGSGAPSPQRIRPARGTGEAGAAGGAPAWPQFPLPARRPHRPLSDNAPLSDLPLPRIPPLRPTGLHNTCVMQTTGRGTHPAYAGGAHGRAPCTPRPRGRSGSAACGLRASQPGIISSPTSFQSCRAYRPARAPPGPGRPHMVCPDLHRDFPPSQLSAGALPAVPPRPLAAGVGPAPRARRARACATSRLHPPLGPPWSAVRRTAHLFPPIPHPMPSAQAPVRPVARPPTGTEGTPRRSAPWPCPTSKEKTKAKKCRGLGWWWWRRV